MKPGRHPTLGVGADGREVGVDSAPSPTPAAK
jgi:hypothetical protein